MSKAGVLHLGERSYGGERKGEMEGDGDDSGERSDVPEPSNTSGAFENLFFLPSCR
jgi:hypothetical protein